MAKTKENMSENKRTAAATMTSENEISKSRQLLKAIQKKKTGVRKVIRKSAPRLCGNRKPMPSLEDLEKMFEDSDPEDIEKQGNGITLSNSEHSNAITAYDTPTSNNKNPHIKFSKSIFNAQSVEIAKKLKYQNKSEESMLSTLVSAPSRSLESLRFSPIPSTSKDSNIFLENDKRLQESSAKRNNPCKESESDEIVIEKISDTIVIDDEHVDIKKYVHMPSTSENSNTFLENDKLIPENSTMKTNLHRKSESDDTVIESINDTIVIDDEHVDIKKNVHMPSTSKNSNTFLENDKQIPENSAMKTNLHRESESYDTVIENINDTIIIDDDDDDEMETDARPHRESTNLDIADSIVIDDYISNDKNRDLSNSVESHRLGANLDSGGCSAVIHECSSVDINQSINRVSVENDCEMVDIDIVIAENSAILQKYNCKKQLNVVTNVEPVNIGNESSHNVVQIEITPNATPQENASSNVELPPSNSKSVGTELSILSVVANFFHRNSPDFQRYMTDNTFEHALNSRIERQNRRHKQRRHPRLLSPQIDTSSSHNSEITSLSVTQLRHTTAALETTSAVAGAPTITGTVVQENRSTSSIGCPICIEPYSGQAVVATICGHVFCKNCLEASLRASGKKCPTCRKALRGAKAYLQLFI